MIFDQILYIMMFFIVPFEMVIAVVLSSVLGEASHETFGGRVAVTHIVLYIVGTIY